MGWLGSLAFMGGCLGAVKGALKVSRRSKQVPKTVTRKSSGLPSHLIDDHSKKE